jgi:hypothetical protein
MLRWRSFHLLFFFFWVTTKNERVALRRRAYNRCRGGGSRQAVRGTEEELKKKKKKKMDEKRKKIEEEDDTGSYRYRYRRAGTVPKEVKEREHRENGGPRTWLLVDDYFEECLVFLCLYYYSSYVIVALLPITI